MYGVDINNLFTSKKYKLSEKRLLLSAIVQQTIYSKSIFPKNSDLYDYVAVFEELYALEKKDKFKPYIYDSRPRLAATISRLMLSKDDLEVEKKLMKFHSELYTSESIESNLSENNSINQKIRNEDSSLLKDIIINRNRKD